MSASFVISRSSTPDEFADKVVDQTRNLHTRSVLSGRETQPISEEYLAEMHKDLVSRCIVRGTADDPQAKF